MVAPWCRAEFPITFLWLLRSGRYPCSLWRTEGWMQNSLCDILQPGPFQPLMYEALWKPTAAICMGCFPTHLFVVLVVILCIVKQEQTTKPWQVWNTYCQPLSGKPPWQCLWCECAWCDCLLQDSLLHFWKSIRCLEVHRKFGEMQHRALLALKWAQGLLMIPRWSLAK